MSIFTRFFGKTDELDGQPGELIANPAVEDPLSLQVLLAKSPKLDPLEVVQSLRGYDPAMKDAKCEVDQELNEGGRIFGLAGWGDHVIRLVGFDVPLPGDALQVCVEAARYDAALKAKAKAHQGHLLLYYAGYNDDPLEQYVALAAVAGALESIGAIVVLNSASATSLPIATLAEPGGLEMLRSLPLPSLFCGVVQFEAEDVPGVWLRTYGAHLFGLPDLAARAEEQSEADEYHEIFDSILNYMRESGVRIEPGRTMPVGEKTYLRFQEPPEDEDFLDSRGELLIVEVIEGDEKI